MGIAALLVFTWFLLWHLWPWWKEEKAKDRAFREGQITRAQAREDEILGDVKEVIGENTAQSKAMMVHIEALTNEVRASRRK